MVRSYFKRKKDKSIQGNCGVIANEFGGGNIYAFVGISTNGDNGKTGWYVGRGCFKKVGRLTVTKVK